MEQKIQIPIATPNKTLKKYSQLHYSTQGFMKPRPVFCREYIPLNNRKVDHKNFVLANPLPIPVFGHARVFNRAFFVPFRTVFNNWNEFYTNTLATFPDPNTVFSTDIPSRVPIITNDKLVSLFVAGAGGSYLLTVTNTTNPDITVSYLNNVSSLSFTQDGIDFLTILESLGYKINWNDKDTTAFSALPLLCYAKILHDWYYPSAYVGSSDYNIVEYLFTQQVNNFAFGVSDIGLLLNQCRFCAYDNDYFVSAFDNPVAPNDLNVERQINIPDITHNGNYQSVTNYHHAGISPTNSQYVPTNGTPFVNGATGASNNTPTGVQTAYIQKALRVLTDYTRRHTLSGVRVLDRYCSELGIKLDNEILKRSIYLGSQSFDIDFGQVLSHADTSGASLGAYAGKGTGFGVGSFDYENGQEFGMFIIVNSIIPQIGYFQGQCKETMHVSALDFYHGDFDHMFVQPINAREVYVPSDGTLPIASPTLNDVVFGFTSKYIEYNVPNDRQTGLYACKGQNGLLPFYSLMRDLSAYDALTNVDQLKHSFGFVIGSDGLQYNRIFANEKLNEMFNMLHSFDVSNYDSTLKPYDTYDFEEDNNEHVLMGINGTKMN